MASNERLHNLYSLANIIRTINSKRMRWEENAACTEKKKIAHKSSVRKTLKKETSYKMQNKWEDTIKMALEETGWGTWTRLTWLMTGTNGRIL
jgi:hypothetical protein